MEQSLEKRVNELLEKNTNLSVSKIVEDAFNSWKQIVFLGIFVFTFYHLFNTTANSVISSMLGTQSITNQLVVKLQEVIKNPDNLSEILVLSQQYVRNPLIIKQLIITNILLLLLFPMQAGLVYCAYKADKEGKATFKDLIIGYQGNNFPKLMGLVIIYLLLMLLSGLLFFLPIFYLTPIFILSSAFILLNNASLLEAIKCSTKIAHKYFFVFLTSLFISFFIGKVLGVMMCYIGLVITLPFSYTMVYSLYKNTIGTNEE